MKRAIVIVVCIATVAGAVLRGQATYPFISEAKQNYRIIKNNLVRTAQKMPDEHYNFKPAAESRSFGEAIAHVADSQARSCSLVNGDSRLVDAAAKTTKADLVAALKESFAICDTAFDAITKLERGPDGEAWTVNARTLEAGLALRDDVAFERAIRLSGRVSATQGHRSSVERAAVGESIETKRSRPTSERSA